MEADKSTDFDKMSAFARRHHVMTLATVGAEGRPWVAHAFYAWVPGGRWFVFMNNPATRHGAEMAACPRVAAAIALETRAVGRLQGLQIEGAVRLAEGGELEAARRAYLRRFPFAVVMEQAIWILEPGLMKFTDNTLGFGKKLIWTK
ncbi:MAG: pyridoxamine 5'-phosphate oxidase family protein [Alistipes sp.]|jgi:uncharacterized protein YhbP (UPF0306 family)|nr:pyridoxamine 5'-phosphate oxidase family protein [Alistipes sp.]